MKCLIAAGATIETCSDISVTRLHRATAWGGQMGLLLRPIKAGADVDAKAKKERSEFLSFDTASESYRRFAGENEENFS